MKKLFILLFVFFSAFTLSAQIGDIDPVEYPLECGTSITVTRLLIFETTATTYDEAKITSDRWSRFIKYYLTKINPNRLKFLYQCEDCDEVDQCIQTPYFISSYYLVPRNINGIWFAVIELKFTAKCTECFEGKGMKSKEESGINALNLSLQTENVKVSTANGMIKLDFEKIPEKELTYMITTNTGQVIQEGVLAPNDVTLDIQTIQSGLYYISLFGENEMMSQSFFVK